MSFADNLQSLLRTRGITAYRLSRDTGCSEGLISDWKRGKRMPGGENLLLLAGYFGVSIDSLLNAPQPYAPPAASFPAAIPILGTIRAGLPILCEEQVEGYYFADVHNPQAHFYLRVQGDSMSGAGIADGSLVLIRKQPDADNGQIVACLLDDETATLKRFCRQGNIVLLLPENSAYEPIIVPAGEFASGRAAVLGVAVSVTTNLL